MMGGLKRYKSNPKKRRRMRFVPQWLARHAATDEADFPPPNSVNDPEALRELIQYTEEGNVVAVRLLARAGVNVNMADEDGWTALHYAADEGQREVAELLAGELGADASLRSAEGLSAPDVAGLGGNRALQEFLLQTATGTAARGAATRTTRPSDSSPAAEAAAARHRQRQQSSAAAEAAQDLG